MIHVAANPLFWNQVWHAPTALALTQRQLAAAFAEAAKVPLRSMA